MSESTSSTSDPQPAGPGNRPTLPWTVVLAATVLALTASGMVLLYASGRDDGNDPPAQDDSSSFTLVPEDEVPTGDPLDIAFTDVDDTTGTLREVAAGGPLVVNFFASWCTPCVAEMPDFESVSNSLDGQVRFFGLAVNDRPEDAEAIVGRTGITYDWSRDIRGDIAAAAGIPQLPATVLVDADGSIAEVHVGALDAGELRSLIRKHLGVTA